MKIPEWCSPDDQLARIGNHSWKVPRLFALSRDLPVMEIPLNHLGVWHSLKNLTLREFVMHMRAVQNADLGCPIILDEDGEIMDGRHRVMKAMLLDLPTIKAVRFDTNPSPDEVHND